MKAADIPGKFPLAFAKNAGGSFRATIPVTTVTPGRASLDQGFPPDTAQPVGSGGIPPEIADVNGILNEISAWSQWLQSGGAPIVYDSTFQANISGYPRGAIVMSATNPGQTFLCLADDNTTNPDTGGANWRDLNRSTFQTFRSGTGIYTPSTGVVRIRVKMVGAGGSGASSGSGSASNDGTQTFLGLFSANPGKGGQPVTSTDGGNGGQGGFGGSNDPSPNATLVARFSGQPGAPGNLRNNDTVMRIGGSGGQSVFGGAGVSIFDGVDPSFNNAKTNTGSGGSGAPAGSGCRGGGGAGEYVEFDYVRPAPMSYQVGQGGAAPVTGSVLAGAGANGIIVIEEKYQ